MRVFEQDAKDYKELERTIVNGKQKTAALWFLGFVALAAGAYLTLSYVGIFCHRVRPYCESGGDGHSDAITLD